jgi:NAD-dependent DNA ligase
MPDYNYSWNESGVDIIATNKSDEQLIKELTNFCQKLDIKNISEGIITKFVEAGIDSIDKILNVKKEDLQNVENFKDKMVQKIFLHISERIKTITLLDLMVASNKFGHGLGERKIKKILDIHPDIIYLYIEMPAKKLIDLIIDIEGFDMITAKKFVSNMPHFLELLNQIPENIQEQILLELPTDNIVSNKMDGFKIVFSGFRNKDWEKHIIENGGSIITAVSKNTTLLVSTQSDIEENTNSKIKTAIKLNILVLNKEDFYDKYIV